MLISGSVFKDPSRNNKDKYLNVHPVKFDNKGNYGVSINWRYVWRSMYYDLNVESLFYNTGLEK